MPLTAGIVFHRPFGAFKEKGSDQFAPNFRVSGKEAAYDSILEGAGNDFMSMPFESDTLYTVWGDTRKGHLQIWFRKFDASSGNTSILKNLVKDQKGIHLYPNPAQSNVRIEAPSIQHIRVSDTEGRIIFNDKGIASKQDVTILTKGWDEGIYVVKILTKSGLVGRQLVKH